MTQLAEQNREEAVVMADIARETRKDSFAMKTIAIVTMVYLPGAFVSVSVSEQSIAIGA